MVFPKTLAALAVFLASPLVLAGNLEVVVEGIVIPEGAKIAPGIPQQGLFYGTILFITIRFSTFRDMLPVA